MLLPSTSFVAAESFVPKEYYANYHFADERSELLDIIIDLDAAWKVWVDVEPKTFNELHDIFETVFEFFPSDPASELTYRKCLLTTQELKETVSRNWYTQFREQCFNPISGLLNKIRTNFTVETKVKANPTNWNAPLNVTLDARDSLDPSNDTIPSDYFFWWYKDVYGDEQPIGKWPVINYTFEDEWNHIVHLTVRSSNNKTQWIFDGTTSLAINVAPKSAEVIVYANGKQLTNDDIIRVWTQDAQEWILIDATSTRPIGARTILGHVWTITNTDIQYTFKKTWEWSPNQFIHTFPRNGVYQIQLEVVDNENNKITEKYKLSVSDPVASIRFQPDWWTTSDTYSFDASASYSLTSRVRTYQWEITDPAGQKIDVLESKQLKRKFTAPGNYTVKLTVTDELWNISYDTEQFYIGSTPPLPSFSVTSSTDLLYPSEFFLDAWASFDEDILNGNDQLTYYWSFAPSEWVEIISQDDTDKKILATFNESGIYTAKLLVEDAYGEIAEIEKKIEVESSLRPELYISPIVAHRWDEMILNATVNKPVAFYEWNMWDGKKQSSNDPSISYTYEKAWVYTVSLNVVTQNGEENTVRQQVFMGQKDMPIIWYEVKKQNGARLQQDGMCQNASWDVVQAYEIDRYENISFDASDSLNTQGTTTDLWIILHPKNDEVYAKSTLNYNFPEIWCTYIDLFIEDKVTWKTANERVWFDVKNALPIIGNLVLDFPQPWWWTNVGVWAATQVVQNREVFNDPSIDPIVVRVHAKWTKDPDWFISHYAWWYYESNNPDNIISLKITPADVPSTSFIIPKPHTNLEYAFAVRMVDNDGGEVTSESVLWKWPVIFFPPGENNFDVPIVTLQANAYQAKVGDEVTFTTDARVLSQNPEFLSARYFKYDFDGDGEYDVTSKQSVVTHYYEKSWEVKPKVAVYYKWRAGIGLADRLIIQKWLKPVLLTDTFGKKLLVKDASRWDIEDSTLCMDIRACRDDKAWVVSNKKISEFTYEETGDYFLQFDVLDTFGNNEQIRKKISIQEEVWLWVLSIPNAISNNEGMREISVWSSLNNQIVFHVAYEAGNCFMDLDITKDTDKDGDPINDSDVLCNKTVPVDFSPRAKTQVARIWYAENGAKKQEDISIVFLDYESVVPAQYEWAVDEIDEIISSLPKTNENDTLSFYTDLLYNLKASLWETNEMTSLLIQLRDLLAERPEMLTRPQQERVMMLINSLSDDTIVQQVYGWSEYDTAKSNIIAWFSDDVSEEISWLFSAFEQAQWNKDDMKVALDAMYQVAAREEQAWTIDTVDLAYVKKNLCDIIAYYELPSVSCGIGITPNDPTIERTWWENNIWWTNGSDGASSWTTKKILRIVIIVVVILAVIFGVLVILFAIKAKRQRDYDDDEDDYDDEEDNRDLPIDPSPSDEESDPDANEE